MRFIFSICDWEIGEGGFGGKRGREAAQGVVEATVNVSVDRQHEYKVHL
jgi:hypothetical protein